MEQNPEEYLTSQLNNGLTLSKRISQFIDWKNGQFTIIRSNQLLELEGHERMDFSQATSLTTAAHEHIESNGRTVFVQYNDKSAISRGVLSEFYHKKIKEKISEKSCAVIAEDDLFSRSESSDSTTDVLYYGEEGYFWLQSSSSKEEIENLFNQLEYSWRSMAFLFVQNEKFIDKSEISDSSLDDIAQNIILMHARAFDSEGYILWCRN